MLCIGQYVSAVEFDLNNVSNFYQRHNEESYLGILNC